MVDRSRESYLPTDHLTPEGQVFTTAASAEEQTPVASVTAEVAQNSAGAWRGSVKVNIVAPITFGAPQGESGAGEAETELRTTVLRMLDDASKYVRGLAGHLNDSQPAEVKVSAKKEKE